MLEPSNGDRLVDREALRELRAAYTHFWDDGQVEPFVGLFTEDGLLQLATTGFARGHEELRTIAESGMSTGERFVVHFTSDEMTQFTGEDTARGQCRMALHINGDTPSQGAGTYIDEYRRTAHGWRFSSRRQRFFYMGPRDGNWPPRPPPVDAPR